jgi:hypothetical protein
MKVNKGSINKKVNFTENNLSKLAEYCITTIGIKKESTWILLLQYTHQYMLETIKTNRSFKIISYVFYSRDSWFFGCYHHFIWNLSTVLTRYSQFNSLWVDCYSNVLYNILLGGINETKQERDLYFCIVWILYIPSAWRTVCHSLI